MAKTLDLAAHVKDALPAALPTVEAVDAQLVELTKQVQAELTLAEVHRVNAAALRASIKQWRVVRDALVPKATREQPVRVRVVELLRGGQMQVADITERLAEPRAAVHSAIEQLVKKGQVEKVSYGVYRLRAAVPTFRPPTLPARTTNPPSAPRPTTLDGLEPLHGAAPKARCPVCAQAKWVDSIGLKEGSYVFRCPDCKTTFREVDRTHKDRP